MTAHRGVLVEPDGTVSIETFDSVDLEALRTTVGARYVDVVRVASLGGAEDLTLDAWVDDEGLFTAEFNPVASFMVASLLGATCQRFHGKMLFVAGNTTTGDSVGLPAVTEKALVDLGEYLAKSL
ncbi:DUF3846 domain-containing protein [Dietzia cinnamea]|uniref:DUF3846 domain-containing protein n=1 Tax=Dietzia cinnamea TaxID=321318 RepID=UPI00223A72CB|nr:DUF3846 domain-containing protein [Dietzia cinnamea]MCT2301155.1 DUF3846 domain-containing protein [Dietzia cinnamea]